MELMVKMNDLKIGGCRSPSEDRRTIHPLPSSCALPTLRPSETSWMCSTDTIFLTGYYLIDVIQLLQIIIWIKYTTSIDKPK